MALIIMLPQRSEIVPNIIEHIYQNRNLMVQKAENAIIQVASGFLWLQYCLAKYLCNCYWMATEFITAIAPSIFIYVILYLWTMIIYVVLSWMWWIRLIMAYVDKNGHGRSIRDIFVDPTMSYLPKKYIISLHIDHQKNRERKLRNSNDILLAQAHF